MITVVGNLKGGTTGKNTVAFNLALLIATRQSTRVSVYDLDPQPTTIDALGVRSEEGYLPLIASSSFLAELRQEKADVQALLDIGLADDLRRSLSEGLAMFEMEPCSKAAAEVEALGKELLRLSSAT